jgi:uncharacterized repeat protein (TIGR01451 family)
MGSFRLRQGPQLRLFGISWRSTLLGLVLGVALLAAAPAAANAAADLVITSSSDSPDPVPVGQLVTYTVTVQNAGPDPATSAALVDELGSGLSVVSANASQGTCTIGSPIICTLDTIAPQASVAVTVIASVAPGATGTVINAATASSPDDTFTEDPDNDYLEEMTTVEPSANLTLGMTAVPDPVLVGDLLTYSLVVENHGPSSASGVSVTDTLPADVTFVMATTPDCAESSGTVTCDAGTLGAQQSKTFDITVRPTNAGTITNTAAAGSPVHDPSPDDRSTSLDVTVSNPPPPPPGAQSDGPKSGPLNVVLTGSYVLISGRSVKLVKGRFVPVRLTCAGPRVCAGTITVTTAKPVKASKKARKKKRKRRIAKLGSKKFSIQGNRQKKVLVPLGKGKVKLLRKLKRVRAKAAIREIDLKGHPRVSTRTFMLRAR